LPETRERWRHRLPHWEVVGRPHFVTIRCAGSLPGDVQARLREIHVNLARIASSSPQFAALQRQYFQTCEKYLDQGGGFAPFHVPAALNALFAALDRIQATADWRVTDAVAMPNHVHLLLVPLTECPTPLRGMIRLLKGRVAREANLALGRRGAFWQSDWFDRWMRDDAEEMRTVAYIRQNPVKAGLVRDWRIWPWIRTREDSAG
jgi:putative transposase